MHVTELPKEDVVKEACEQIYLAYRKYDSYNDPLWNGEMSFEEKIREILISNVRFLSSFGSYKKTYNIEDFAVTIHYSYSEDIEKDLFEIDLLHKNTSFTRRMNFVLNPFMERQIDYENRE